MIYPMNNMNRTYKRKQNFTNDLKNVLEGSYYIISKKDIGINICFFPRYWKLY